MKYDVTLAPASVHKPIVLFMIVLIHTFHQQPVQSVLPTRIPGDHRGETTPRLASSNKKESVDATIISSSFLVCFR